VNFYFVTLEYVSIKLWNRSEESNSFSGRASYLIQHEHAVPLQLTIHFRQFE